MIYTFLCYSPVADPGFGQGGANWSGGPTLKREGCTPDFIESYSLLGAKQRKMFALTLGLGGPGPPGLPWIRYCSLGYYVTFRIQIYIDNISPSKLIH